MAASIGTRMTACWLLATGMWLSGGPGLLAAQPRADTSDAATRAAAALAQVDAATASDALIEWLTERVEDPLDLNAASADALARLPGLTPVLAARVVRRRTDEGPFASPRALLAVAGMDEATYRAVRPFVRVATPPTAHRGLLHRVEGRLIQRMTRRLDVGRGYATDTTGTGYAGSPTRWYTRLQLASAERLRFNLTLEKDPGEAFHWQPETGTYGFDHLAAHLAVHDWGPVETLVLGDYSVAFGQGVALWRAFSFSKGRDVIGPATRRGAGVDAFGSTEENRFFRGLAATLRPHRQVAVTAFASRRTLDATLEQDPTRGWVPTNLTTSGLHRTPTERRQRDAVQDVVAGGALAWTRPALHVGVAGYYSRLDRALVPSDRLYRRYDFAGRTHRTVSVFADATVGAVHAFGELAGRPGAWGGIGGLLVDAAYAEAVISMRRFAPDLVTRYGQAFGEASGPPQNEHGVYLGLRVRPAPTWQLSGYIDQYSFPWLRFATPRPTTGHDVRLVIAHAPRSWLSYHLQLRSETREEGATITAPGSPALRGVRPRTRQSARLHGEYAFTPALRFQMRLTGTRHRDEEATTTGVLLYQGVRWHATPWLRMSARWALFDTANYATRVYAYEHDLLYTFSVPVFSGRGQRHYALLRLTPTSRMTVEVKYGATRYRGADTVGSGLDEVAGNRIRAVRAQVRWAF